MRFESRVVEVATKEKVDFRDVTREVAKVVSEVPIQNGLLVVHMGHTTAAITVNEADPTLLRDAKRVLNRLVPVEGDYEHNRWTGEANAHAHILGMLLSSSVTVPIIGGRMGLGTWQSLMLVEMDGPRRRQVTVMVVGE